MKLSLIEGFCIAFKECNVKSGALSRYKSAGVSFVFFREEERVRFSEGTYSLEIRFVTFPN